MSYQIIFEPGSRIVSVSPGTTIAEAAERAGVELHMPCAGQGVCGGCVVVIRSGNVQPSPRGTGKLAPPSQESLASQETAEPHGVHVLACQAVPVSDLVVDVSQAEQRTKDARHGITAADVTLSEPVPEGDGCPLARTMVVEVKKPTVQDSTPDLTRLLTALAASGPKCQAQTITLDALRALPGVLRANGSRVAATVVDQGFAGRIIAVSPVAGAEGSANGRPTEPTDYGIAVDVGTSTVAVQLVDMTHRVSLGTSVARNRQVRYGEDIIGRIIWAEERAEGLSELRQAALATINGLINQLTKAAGIQPEQVVAASCAANATMTSLLLGIECAAIRRSPHVPPAAEVPGLTAREVGIGIHPDATVFLHPSVSGFVGGDITAGVMATGMDQSEQLSLLVDVGTNGEIVVGSSEWLMCCSCSAGPAFEGVGIGAGMPASIGAIHRLRYDPQADDVEYEVVGHAPPRGVCGTGLLEALASLFEGEIIDRAGTFNPDAPTHRLRQGEFQLEFVLVFQGERGAPRDVVLTQSDIEHLIRSKAAVHAGIEVLLRAVGLSSEMIERVYLAGAFGTHLNVEAAITIGMIPPVPASRITFAGNSSLRGALHSLMARTNRERVSKIAQRMTYLELSEDPTFMEEYVASLFLPHTDVARFERHGTEASPAGG